MRPWTASSPTPTSRGTCLVANGVGRGKIKVSPYGIDTSHHVQGPTEAAPILDAQVGFVGDPGTTRARDALVGLQDAAPGARATLSIHGIEKLRVLRRGLRAPRRGRRKDLFLVLSRGMSWRVS